MADKANERARHQVAKLANVKLPGIIDEFRRGRYRDWAAGAHITATFIDIYASDDEAALRRFAEALLTQLGSPIDAHFNRTVVLKAACATLAATKTVAAQHPELTSPFAPKPH